MTGSVCFCIITSLGVGQDWGDFYLVASVRGRERLFTVDY